MKKQTPKAQQEASPAATFLILLVSSIVVIAIGSLVLLQQDTWVQLQKLWLISRAAAIAAYVVLTLIVLLGIILSHPRNKDTWRLTPKLLPWHQALVGILFALVFVHLIFSVVDSKSGVTLHTLLNPMNSKYHPLAMTVGVAGFYLLLVVGMTAGLRKWIKLWLPTHRISIILWAFLSLHGFYGGTDSLTLEPLYEAAALLVIGGFFWRHWTNNKRMKSIPQVQEIKEENMKGGNAIEPQN
ncbi:hypothetical protein JZ785_24250 [Alicyclobacillus curvatus]|nr:hypothetical protein JZ785_24250 [Alicyclobacillus curvatus]